jgi:hypothetical protein
MEWLSKECRRQCCQIGPDFLHNLAQSGNTGQHPPFYTVITAGRPPQCGKQWKEEVSNPAYATRLII